METLEAIINNGFDVRIYSTIKRMGTPPNRDWYKRFCWEIRLDDKRIGSEWEGFETAQQAIQDLIDNVSKI